MVSVLRRDTQRRDRRRRGEGHLKMDAASVVMQKKRNRKESLEEARKDPPTEPLEGVWPCQHLDF